MGGGGEGGGGCAWRSKEKSGRVIFQEKLHRVVAKSKCVQQQCKESEQEARAPHVGGGHGCA